ncbi:aspartate/glutamate racemase family protein [Kalamiella sp. sgz302252]|uniref:aspartate/glutamate racemase family protein n=1 Tax=Pantoea sp. sgz302252 TaxID=3341827 RepID=UPI0036D26F36
MKTLGLIGGMSWASTIPYYRLINEGVQQRLGGLHSAKLALYSVDFAEIEACQVSGDWEKAGLLLAGAALALKKAGAEGIVICANTMHKVADAVADRSGLPLLHIADATAAAIREQNLTRVALLGTRYTMEQNFIRERLARAGIETLIPNEEQRQEIHRLIFAELCHGVITPQAKKYYQQAIEALKEQGAQGVIFGCTEIGLLLKAEDCPVPVFDTTVLHAAMAVEFMLSAT